MFKPFVGFVLGILLGYYLGIPSMVFFIGVIVFLVLGLLWMYGNFGPTRYIAFSGISFLLAMVSVGAFNYSIKKGYQPLEDGFYTYSAVIDKVISRKTDYSRVYLEVLSVKEHSIAHSYRIVSNIYDKEILPGDTVFASSYFKPLMHDLNPGQFNVKKYFAYKYIYHTTTLQPNKFLKSTFQNKFHFQRWCQLSSQWCRSVIKEFIPVRSASTIQALLLGVKDDVSEDMMEVYTKTGVMHALAVSGMHVGILYLGMLAILRPIYRRWKWISFLPILLIWLFSFITGAGPAVLRAALMITFVVIGKRFDEDSHPVNLLLVSGILILIFQPYLLWDIGFQLSFSAMLGLFYLMKPLQNMIYIRRKWVKDYIWSTSVMSISAQLSTMPFAFYYFGNFSFLFLLTNLIILLPLTICLYGAVVLLISSKLLPIWLNLKIGFLLDHIIYYGFNAPLQFIYSIPGSFASHIYIAFWQVIILSLSVFFFGYWLYHIKNGRWLLYSLFLLTISIVGTFSRQILLKNDTHIHILHANSGNSIAVNNFLWTGATPSNTVIQNNPFFLNGYLRELGWKDWTYIAPKVVEYDTSMLAVGHQRFYLLNESLYNFSEAHKIEVEYLILGNHLYLNIEDLLKKFKFKHIILDGALDYSKYAMFKKILDANQISYIDTRSNGAHQIKL
ncbi:MAG TPA: ComEC/Rec2 family competence protein [Chitinophagales bacterium]|nr:ComEC/Rec2 family competence protein [Chitinophagales bacterium]